MYLGCLNFNAVLYFQGLHIQVHIFNKLEQLIESRIDLPESGDGRAWRVAVALVSVLDRKISYRRDSLTIGITRSVLL